MRRILSLIVVALVMAAMLVMTAAAALADPPPITGVGSQGKGAIVIHCEEFFGAEGGNFVFTPSGNANVHCR
jgi:hypothetical protein